MAIKYREEKYTLKIRNCYLGSKQLDPITLGGGA